MPTSEVIRLKNVRLSFPSLFKQRLPKGEKDPSKAKYRATFLLDPSKPEDATQIAAVKAAAKTIRAAQWGDAKVSFKGLCFKLNTPPKPGEESDDDEPIYDGWENMFSVVTSEDTKPKVVNAKGVPVNEGEAGAPYGGCYVDAWISLWTQDNTYGKRINANVIAVQFRADGTAFSARQAAADGIEFEDLSGQAPVSAATDDEAF